jgi:hypothetical protein
MRLPKCNKVYFFVRSVRGHIEYVEFVLYEDDSASYVVNGKLCGIEEDPAAWKMALDAIQDGGYVESFEAMKRGIIPSDWVPETVYLSELR